MLEVGIGTGQATEPFLKVGCFVTAVELGDSLAAYTKEKFSRYDNFEIINSAFEEYKAPKNSFDMVYAATSFHWIPDEIGYPHVFNMLKNGGTFTRFRTHSDPYKDNEPFKKAIQEAYKKHTPALASAYIPMQEYIKKTSEDIVNAGEKYGFVDVICQQYYQTRTINAADYAKLIGTFSDHINLGKERLALLQEGITDVINDFGGKIEIHDIIDLQFAKKP